ncbi:MAG: HAMP domain-containing histidine kinase [Nitrospira sp.]|nr:HAMP domain-containing histidine kinase [Nitrospira sp.]
MATSILTQGAVSGEDAYGKLLANRVDVVVTDIVMPVMSGIELLQKINELDPDIPVILMTAYADMNKVIEAIKIGAFDFIIKPFNPELFVHSVDKAIHFNKMLQTEHEYKYLLEEYNKEIETLISERTMSLMALTIADKVRNPSSIIGLTCRRMLDKEELTPPVRTKLQSLVEEADKLDMIVTDFHTLLKSKQSMFVCEDMNNIVKSVLPVLEKKALQNKIELSFTSSDYPVKLNIQKNLFKIAVSHLVKNSIESMPGGGKIAISVYESKNDIILEIADAGHGISEEDMSRIFDPMYSTKEQRYGMGLALVKQIVSEHMGQIYVQSTLGVGSVFRIILPVRWIGKEGNQDYCSAESGDSV